jgi:hypothetical protein
VRRTIVCENAGRLYGFPPIAERGATR